MTTPPTRFHCSLGHFWEATGSAPLVCPTCGSPPAPTPPFDPEQTVDQDSDRTVDLPTPKPLTAAVVIPPPPRPTGNSVHPAETARSETARSTPRPTTAAPSSESAVKPPLAMPFTILRQHARGGLGVVNLARDENIRREVALKQILPQHGDNPILQKRFLYEAQITGQLEHPSIVPVYTLGHDEMGNPYYVMRFVRGRTLDTIIIEHHASPNPIVMRELLRRFIAVCQALAYAHSRGVIHRDLKPSNIMLGDYGETLVLDWGLAKDIKNKVDPALFSGPPGAVPPATAVTGASAPPPAPGSLPVEQSNAGKSISLASQMAASELTMAGQIIGTPAYMAPEQADGRTDLHGPVTDIYALGGILYKILAGQSPQTPTPSQTGPDGQRRLTFVESPPPSTINKDVHPVLEQICMRAMAKEPAARYPRALELAQDIQRWLDEHPLSLKRETTFTKILALVRRFAPLIILILLLAIVLLMLAIQRTH